MERYLCIHGHFYQPPRENPWLEAVEIQDSAHPYHDWNERVTAECYAQNSASRILDGCGRITEIVSNYARMSFNFGPTLLSWMEASAPEVYRAVIEADRLSVLLRSGHGNALAQVYNHLIMPLASPRDRRTQIVWGIRDFVYRFGRRPEGMWLAETAADTASLDALAEHGITFTVLAPHQACRVRKIGAGRWKDVHGGRIDPTRPYLCKLPSGRKTVLFFYDGPISRAVAFEGLLNRGECFAHRLLDGFSGERDWPQLLPIAVDGETFGHHHRHGDMALAYALHYLESQGHVRLTNYGEYLAKHPPAYEVEILENTSWSCAHGIERWRGDCGCCSGMHPGWGQGWRTPLREALDRLRDDLAEVFEQKGKELLAEPWEAGDDYIGIMLDRSAESREQFVERHAVHPPGDAGKVAVFKLLEMRRHMLLMYTSCGWFFDELSGLETLQVLSYAGRAVQLAEELTGRDFESGLLAGLSRAKSNLPENGNGADLYLRYVKPSMITLKKVGAHYAISSLFEEYGEETRIYCYTAHREEYRKLQNGGVRMAVGRTRIVSRITGESEEISFCVLHFGAQSFNGGVRSFLGEAAYRSMRDEMIRTFGAGDLAEILRLMDKHFGMHNYSLRDLFRDEQRRIVALVASAAVREFERSCRRMYEGHRILMTLLMDTGIPLHKAFSTAAGVTLSFDLREALKEAKDIERVRDLAEEIRCWDLFPDTAELEPFARKRLEETMEGLRETPYDMALLQTLLWRLEALRLLPFETNLWQSQNIYYSLAAKHWSPMRTRAADGNEEARRWRDAFKAAGEMMFFNTDVLLPEAGPEKAAAS
ncbi:MAG: DUF3536 domain-containing protein [Alphaproteobacteria bacterium]|uniref:DUF3536 domain-containing protein n=1 Tax=Candidatus Nitrobium versatile TaxID=2884831 RepID=A0A953JDG6_9BACT|nr:DUF3536 domain-containing protein [Candidatus Nitrobium versatile]